MPTGFTSATKTATKIAICSQPCAIRGSPPAAGRRPGRRRPAPRRQGRRDRQPRTPRAAAHSYPVDQVDRPVEEGEESDRDRYCENVGGRTTAPRKDVGEDGQDIPILRRTPSRPREFAAARIQIS